MLYLNVYRREKNPTLLEINNQPSCQMALLEKDPPANAGHTRGVVQFLGQEDHLEEETATCSGILA